MLNRSSSWLHQSFLAVGLTIVLGYLQLTSNSADAGTLVPTISSENLSDKIRGGLLGQLLGNLNGLEHENKYIAEPGHVESYVPELLEGAQTDDDTDFEWVYIIEMQRRDEIFLPHDEIANMWKTSINRRIWCANQYARLLMDLDLDPPYTGKAAFNPWANFNISGQFLCETFALIAPGLPDTAGRIGLHYTNVAIDLEPAQTTQLFTAMISKAFFIDDINQLIDEGLHAVDERSELHELIANVRKWHAEHPEDWRATRLKIKEAYTRNNGSIRDFNGYELNTAATIAALLYGNGDFTETLRIAFSLGWDCDNVAATAGTILGVVHGYKWMMSQDWKIVDRYRNTTRDQMPMDETITSFADRLIILAEKVIVSEGGKRVSKGTNISFDIPNRVSVCVSELPNIDQQTQQLRTDFQPEIERDLKGSDPNRQARAAYLAICLDLAEDLSQAEPDAWKQAVDSLQKQQRMMQFLYYGSNVPEGIALQKKMSAFGLKKPERRVQLWKPAPENVE